jgi:hypothetical protein
MESTVVNVNTIVKVRTRKSKRPWAGLPRGV